MKYINDAVNLSHINKHRTYYRQLNSMKIKGEQNRDSDSLIYQNHGKSKKTTQSTITLCLIPCLPTSIISESQ